MTFCFAVDISLSSDSLVIPCVDSGATLTINVLAMNDSIVEGDEHFTIEATVNEVQTLDSTSVALTGSFNQVVILQNDCKF